MADHGRLHQDPLTLPPPGTGAIRLRVRVPSGRSFAVGGSTFSELLAEGWIERGELATSVGPVEAREHGTEGLLLRDAQQTYRYTYATETLVVLQTAARVRLEWQYAPAFGPAVAFDVWRRVGEAGIDVLLTSVEPVDDRPATYRYLDTAMMPGLTYTYHVTARTAAGTMSPASALVTVAVPHALEAPRNVAAVFLPMS